MYVEFITLQNDIFVFQQIQMEREWAHGSHGTLVSLYLQSLPWEPLEVLVALKWSKNKYKIKLKFSRYEGLAI